MNLTRGITALGVVVLCGAAVAAAGPIAFVGLVIPHMVRLVVGADYRWILAFSAILGPVLLLGADIIGRVEISYFGSHQPDEQDYLDCRRSFEALTRSLGRAVSGLGDRP